MSLNKVMISCCNPSCTVSAEKGFCRCGGSRACREKAIAPSPMILYEQAYGTTYRTKRPQAPARRVPQNPERSSGFCTSVSPTPISRLWPFGQLISFDRDINCIFEFFTPNLSLVFQFLEACISAHSYEPQIILVSFDSAHRALSNDIYFVHIREYSVLFP